MAEMLHHTRAVNRAVKNAMLVGDMPFEAYQEHPETAVKNARGLSRKRCGAVNGMV